MKISISSVRDEDFRNLTIPGYYLKFRRILEILFILAFSPLIIVAAGLTASMVWMFSGKPVIFKQCRPGRRGELFEIYKFRTLDSPKELFLEYNLESKMTRIGRFLRRHRLDELPQFWNIIKGNMSLIGPRPDPYFSYNDHLKDIPYYNCKFALTPGLTGWAQVNFKHTDNPEDASRKVEYELFYLKNLSAALDLKIIFKTVAVMFLGKCAR